MSEDLFAPGAEPLVTPQAAGLESRATLVAEATIVCAGCGATVAREHWALHVCGSPNETDGAELRRLARRACELWLAEPFDRGAFNAAMRALREACR